MILLRRRALKGLLRRSKGQLGDLPAFVAKYILQALMHAIREAGVFLSRGGGAAPQIPLPGAAVT